MIKRIFVEKKDKYQVEAKSLKQTFQRILKIQGLESMRILYRYDVEGVKEDLFKQIIGTILSEPNVDKVFEDSIQIEEGDKIFGISYLPGQYDQHGDSAVQCIQIVSGQRALVKVAKIVILTGALTQTEFDKIKHYMINPVDSQETSLEPFETLTDEIREPQNILPLVGFITLTSDQLEAFRQDNGFAMTTEDLQFVQNYFNNDEKRNPTITELKVIDTYWSDHCRHTTFLTQIQQVTFLGDDPISQEMKQAYDDYSQARTELYGKNTNRPISLMDLAVMGTKILKKQERILDLDESEEINACSINIVVDHDGVDENWLLMFKNETHNHPTEIEPFGGAATCLGGAIRDPLSGRSYVYQAMRVTGAWDPRSAIEDTLPGKLPQRKISTEAAHGYSSYGNQIGLATGQVTEIYDPGFLAKRMEVGAVIAATPKENVIRERPVPGDVVLLVGGRTGRDGCGGATGSSKAHTEESILESGAEVQKGNPVEERKIQRLFRNKKLANLIKRCNDFGAGGVSVAIGELADSLEIDLDQVPKKYEGLDGTELAISESQERMAVVVEAQDVETFIAMGNAENLEVTPVAVVTDSGRLVMKWREAEILNISRAFLETNGAPQFIDVVVEAPHKITEAKTAVFIDFKSKMLETLKDLNVASQRGMVEMFDSTIGAGTVAMPYGGKNALSPMDGMVAKIPMCEGDTTTCSMMTFGYNPVIAKQSPYLGGMMGVLESLSKLAAMGGDYKQARLSFQEYFERLGTEPVKWGRPFAALLGAYQVQTALGTPAIGGKDSMSGTFGELTVPPTLISFAVATAHVEAVITSEIKSTESLIQLFTLPLDDNGVPELTVVKAVYDILIKANQEGKILSAKTVGLGGLAEAVAKMSFGNGIGVTLNDHIELSFLFKPLYGGILIESFEILEGSTPIGKTNNKGEIIYAHEAININELVEAWETPLRSVYPEKVECQGDVKTLSYEQTPFIYSKAKILKPQVFIPVFPGTNCEYDSVKAFENAGAKAVTTIFRNQTVQDISQSIDEMVATIKASQMIMIPGGFSAGDQPNGSGKFIAAVFRNPKMMDAVMELLNKRDGLVLGICNGFQALIKLGLVPNGEICEITDAMPTLTFNTIGRHVSTIPMTRISSNLSPWLANTEVGDVYRMPMSHGEGRFVASDEVLETLIKNGQIATQYVDFEGNATLDGRFNPNGSVYGVEGITSLDGRVLGKMGHSERIGKNLYKNIPGNMDQQIFKAGVNYFK
ncbi:phosphoribosylformylglycinamidine synthase [Acetobacterium woodii]|uniref:Phosphoribosylformylglycinamidine synthase II n=1 Tax=Acetobacterium woodii (strain ATCC 29683 / DSM 1030 / JCM 2381 / KCTC 1655 / WB1) TaxID=931626 RepID=H6LH77_ACEWD|nr:phosphoribosylformylglycinamidine synthase [Acetobacterium woodii]AFA48415.1 phosphoribosylformylglycinamidine synthase II [Acetobacterium woodii DSM 1030]